MSPTDWSQWRDARPETKVLHLDTAAAGRASLATLAAVSGHARLEAEVGGYVAAELASEQLAAVRVDVATVLACDPEGIAFVESGTAALVALLGAWPLPDRARVGVPASEWGTNLDVLRHRGLELVTLPTDADGVLDLEALGALLRSDPPDVLLIDQVSAHRGLVQPLAEVVPLCRSAGVPLWVDAAQSAGHVAVPAGADAVFATSRKWLTGPRGVGILAVAPDRREALDVTRLGKRPDASPVQLLESDEAHVAGRVGLAVAVRELLDLGLDTVSDRLVEVGRLVRESVTTVPGWEVAHPNAPAGAITALVATSGQDVAAAHRRLLDEHGVVTTVGLPWRAPLESGPGSPPLLRISPHVDLTTEDLERLARSLGTD